MSITLYKGDIPADLDFGDSIAIDTETLGLVPERDPLCLIQLSSGDGNAHLLQFDRSNYDAPNLKKILSNDKCEKIFHFARFDVAVIRHYLKIDCEPIYCTKIASKLARTYTDKHGLKDLCKELLNVELSKTEQTSDWSIDELTEDQKKYAASDVLYLHKLKVILEEKLTKLNRKKLADDCFSFISTRSYLDLNGWSEIDIFRH
ncbi:MAG: ribonuclease H-like domain-containing protein [Pseudomonadota bacterium]|nr:ribonuclease H-like domain-containing protein [Pseudomonadota bacterium]